jgi:hypothetical protein
MQIQEHRQDANDERVKGKFKNAGETPALRKSKARSKTAGGLRVALCKRGATEGFALLFPGKLQACEGRNFAAFVIIQQPLPCVGDFVVCEGGVE